MLRVEKEVIINQDLSLSLSTLLRYLKVIT